MNTLNTADTTSLDAEEVFAFLDRVERGPAPGCWAWTGTFADGKRVTPIFAYKGRRTPAARWAFDTWVEPVERGYNVQRVCGTVACINPEHHSYRMPGAATMRRLSDPDCAEARRHDLRELRRERASALRDAYEREMRARWAVSDARREQERATAALVALAGVAR